jgi:xanthine dehydrogenase YagR molybdenum-binding subunit
MIEWKKLWRPRGQGARRQQFSRQAWLGLSLHTWGGGGHASDCDLTIHPDGSVEIKLGSQDLGTGTRTTIQIVVADSLGVARNQVKVTDRQQQISAIRLIRRIDDDRRRQRLFAPRLDRRAQPAAGEGRAERSAPPPTNLKRSMERSRSSVRPTKSITWKQACAKLGTQPLTTRGKHPGKRA